MVDWIEQHEKPNVQAAAAFILLLLLLLKSIQQTDERLEAVFASVKCWVNFEGNGVGREAGQLLDDFWAWICLYLLD